MAKTYPFDIELAAYCILIKEVRLSNGLFFLGKPRQDCLILFIKWSIIPLSAGFFVFSSSIRLQA